MKRLPEVVGPSHWLRKDSCPWQIDGQYLIYCGSSGFWATAQDCEGEFPERIVRLWGQGLKLAEVTIQLRNRSEDFAAKLPAFLIQGFEACMASLAGSDFQR
jgi:hypothetical protein